MVPTRCVALSQHSAVTLIITLPSFPREGKILTKVAQRSPHLPVWPWLSAAVCLPSGSTVWKHAGVAGVPKLKNDEAHFCIEGLPTAGYYVRYVNEHI